MTNAKRDDNRKPTLLGVDPDNSTVTVLGHINPVTNRLKVRINGGTGSIAAATVSKRDENRIPTALAVKSTDTTATLPVRARSSNNRLLIALS